MLSDQSFIGEVNYQYDALGRKVGKELIPSEGSKKEREYYLYNGLGTDILAEYQDETGNGFSRGRNPSQVREYYYGNGLLLAQKLYLLEGIGDPRHRLSWTNATLDLICYSQDALGSVTLITGQGGKVLGKYRYDAYGNAYNGRFEGCVFGEDEFDNFWDWDNDESVAAATSDGFTAQGWGWPGIGYGWGHYKHGRSWGILRQGNVYGFTGERFEPELGVYSFTFRDYNPRTMRWMTKDPIKDGTNWYQYCNGDPVNWVDLLGLEDDCTIGPQPENTFETYTTKWTAGATTVDDGIYIQPVASVRTEVVGNVDVESDGKNVNVELDAAIGATSSLNPEAGITVDVNVTVEVNLVNKEGEIVDTESVYVGSTEAKVPGASPEEMFDTRVNDEEIQLTLPDGANPSDYSVKVTITGSFGNADGESFVVPRSFEKDAITVPVCNKSSK